MKTIRVKVIELRDEAGALKIGLRASIKLSPSTAVKAGIERMPSTITFFEKESLKKESGSVFSPRLELNGGAPGAIVFWKSPMRHVMVIAGAEGGGAVCIFGSDFRYGFHCVMNEGEGEKFLTLENRSQQQCHLP